MASVESWQFTQKLAGIAWAALGLTLAVVMAVLCSGFRGVPVMDMVNTAIRYLLWEIGLLILCNLGIWITVLAVFDRQGCRRQKKV